MKPTRIIGWIFTVISLLAIIQSIREFRVELFGDRAFASGDLYALPFEFAGHSFAVVDDQPFDTDPGSQAAREGTIQLVVDGHRIGTWSRALVRPSQRGLSRYHLWLSIWKIQERATGQTTLWIARRIQPSDFSGVRIEVTTVRGDGSTDRQLFRPWQLSANYPLLRSSSPVAEGTVGPFPLSVLSGFIFPLVFLVFPIGTLLVGVVLLVRTRGRPSVPRAA